MIELRSDTLTQPTAGMRAAIAAAAVGDEQKREDPTVLELERRGAELLGQEESVYLPTATMANQIALTILGERGTELIVEETAHIMVAELGGAARHSGLVTRGLRGERGILTPDQVRETYRSGDGHHIPRTGILALENTHNTGGGRVWSYDELTAVVETGRDLDLRLHLDGARLLNASVASGIPAAEYARLADTVQICFSKGLGCPLGAILAGSADIIEQAWRQKFLFGGALRQAGVVAAAMLYALDHHIERLAEDHARAKRLAEGLAAAGLPVDVEATETNFVGIDVASVGMEVREAQERIAEHGVRVGLLRPGVVRVATHLGVSDDDIDSAIELIPRALGVLAAA